MTVYVYDISGNGTSYDTTGVDVKELYYTGSGWVIPNNPQYLTYGVASTNTGYTYTDTSGSPPDLLTVSLPLSFAWLSISQGDIVDVQFGSGTNGTILSYGSSTSSYYVEYTGTTANTISVVYFKNNTINWPFYYDYTSSSNTNAGEYTFYSGGSQNTTFVTVNNNTDTSGTFSFSSTNGYTNQVYIVVGNITAGETFYVQSNVSFSLFVAVYDIFGNGNSYTVSKNVTVSLYYTGRAWIITS
jgi:hypothetical protein